MEYKEQLALKTKDVQNILKGAWRKISKDNKNQEFKYKHQGMLCKLEDIVPSPDVDG